MISGLAERYHRIFRPVSLEIVFDVPKELLTSQKVRNVSLRQSPKQIPNARAVLTRLLLMSTAW